MATVSIKGWANKIGASLPEAALAIKMELFSGVIEDTRVDTGRLRGNWQTSTGFPIGQTTGRLDPSGELAKAEMRRNITPDGVDYMTNNLDYAAVYEEKDGMIARNMARITTILRSFK